MLLINSGQNVRLNRWARKMANKITNKNGVKVFNIPGKVNPIARDPHDNTTDLEQATFAAQSRRKFTAPDSSTPGKKRTTNPETITVLPS